MTITATSLQLLTLEQVARKLNVSATTLWRLRKQPEFPDPVLLRGKVQFVESEIDEWILDERDNGKESCR